MRIWAAGLVAGCLAWPGAAMADTARIVGGLHDTFSRLVVTFDSDVSWQLGRAPGGYQLRATNNGVLFEYDLRRAFELLPPDHILNIRPGPGSALFIDIGCICFADAFELEPGTLVIDIVEGPAPADAQFEENISPEGDNGQSNVIALALQEATGELELVTQASSGPQSQLPLLFETPPVDAPPTVATTAIAPVTLPQDMDAPPLTSANTEMGRDVLAAQDPEPAEQEPMDNNALFSDLGAAPAQSGSEIFSNSDSLGVPSIALTDVTESEQERINSARSNLVEQLQRAVSQGIVQFPKDSIQIANDADDASAAPAPVENDETRPESEFDRREHVFIETAADRDALDPVVRALKVNSARDCLPGAWFDVASWHGEFPDYPSLEGLRAELVGEFDKVNVEAAIMLAERYLYLGFGAEARSLLRGFDIKSAQSEVLSDLGATVDLQFSSQSDMFLRQQVCDSPAAIWAILADPAFGANADVNPKTVLKHFSELPVHLRNHIGPVLAQRFIAANDPATTTAIRNIIDRSAFGDPTAIALIEAHVELDNNDTEAATPLLETVVAQDGPEAAEALAELIENRFAEGLPIDGKLAQSADALAVEYRGTPTGARLVKASIRAFSVAGEPSTTFDRIFDALENGSISEEEARVLRAEAHLGSAQYSDDVDFLRYVFLFPFETDLVPGVERKARRMVARRLLENGLLDQALLSLPLDPATWTQEDRVIAAGVSVEQDQPLQAMGYVRGMEEEEARILAARALEDAGQLEAAAASFKGVGLDEQSHDLSWRAGDWATLMQTGDPIYSMAAHLATGEPLVAEDGTSQQTLMTELELPGQTPLAQGRAMIETSRLSRQILTDLLARTSSSQP